MASFVLICHDRPGALALRQSTRAAHLDYLAGHADMIRLAGPLLDANGDPCGSIFLLEAMDLEAVRALSDADPYALAGLFERVEASAWRQTIPALA